MRHLLLPLAVLALSACTAGSQPRPNVAASVPAALSERAERWWTDVAALSDDAMEGRGTGTAGHERAMAYVEARLRALGLQPGGTDGYRQPISVQPRAAAGAPPQPPVPTANLVAVLRGADPALRDEYVVMTAHLDHLGIGEPVNGDRIYNGTLDNAAGSAALLDIAQQLQRTRPRRSILLIWLSGEELGLRGARAFVETPTVPREAIVANLNYDMALPLFPLRSVTVIGADQSSLGADAAAVGRQLGLPLAPDPFPARRSFVRSDHFAFIERGIPAVAFKFGFAAGTPEARLEGAFRDRIYHSPQDDPNQAGIFREDEIRLHDFIAALALRVANADVRPTWNADSIYRNAANR